MDEQQQGQPMTKKQRRELKRQEKIEGREKAARKKTTSRIIMWVVIVVALGGMVYGLTLLGDGDSTTGPILTDAVTDSDQTKGSDGADVVLVEYSDFQCPACATYYSIINQLAEEFPNDIQIAYRHFPLRSIHPNAQLAAQAAEAAGAQGNFWGMHDELFAKQSSWSNLDDPTDSFVTFAETLGLDTEQFRTDLTSDTIIDKVNADYRSGTAARVNSTPSFFLQGEKIDNPRTYDEFATLIREAVGAPAADATETNSDSDHDGDSMEAETTEE